MRYAYRFVDTGEDVEVVRPAQAMPDDLVIDGRAARRVWDSSTVPHYHIDQGGGITYKRPGLPISHSLPTMDLSGAEPERLGDEVVYRKGKCLADARGRRVVRNKNDSDAHCRDTGFIKDSV
jgi:hypothetical protein